MKKTSINASLHQLKLTKFAGTNLIDTELEFPISLSAQKTGTKFAQKHSFTKKTIAFCAQSERTGAQVPINLLVKIGNYLIKKGYSLYFVYGPNEKKKALNVYNSITDKTACIIAYKMPEIAQVKAIFENCAMYVGNDGGNKHIAVTANICTIGLFFGDNPKVWTPDKPQKHRFLQTQNNNIAYNDFVDLFEGWDFNKSEFNK
ncbi:MAG: hypothetical protein L3J06_06340 [Cyclobacteriaceae bacterium]|nr:hypothetical protein [Cyclobacteriaceae bacterium]